MQRFCNCRRCKKIRREKRMILGSRWTGFWLGGTFGWMKVSDYVRHPKFQSGRVRKDRRANTAD